MSKAVTALSTYDEYYNAIATGTTIIKFSGAWCAPCKKIAGPYATLAGVMPHIKFHEIDIDDVQEVADKEEVMALPQFIAYYNGERLFSYVGANESKLRDNIYNWLRYIDDRRVLLADPDMDKLSSIVDNVDSGLDL
jgi:thioredoxin 1